MEEIGNGSTWSVQPDSLAGTMRGYDIEQAEDAFRNHGFNTHVIASYQNAEHTSLYDWSAASMRRISSSIDTADWQLHVRLFEWYDSNFNEWCVDVYTHTEATPIHKDAHLGGNYWEYSHAIKMVKHIMPQWSYTYDEFANYNEDVEAFVSNFQEYPFT